MDINSNIVSIIDILGCLQGIILGFLLLYANRNQKRSAYFLGLFVLVFAYGYIPVILEDMGFMQRYPYLFLMPRVGEWLLAPLFLIYVQQTSILSNRLDRWTLIPGLVFLAFQLVLFFVFPSEQKEEIAQQPWYRMFFLIGLVFSVILVVYIHLFINKHALEVKNQYSQIANKQLHWARLFNIFGFVLIVLHVIHFFISDSFAYRLFFSLANVFMLYWASLNGFFQQKILSFIPEGVSEEGKTLHVNKTIDFYPEEDQQILLDRIDVFMRSSKAYTKRELTIVEVASELGEHPRRISKAINMQLKMNFNAYVNRFRIEEAEAMLNDEKFSNLSIEGIGLEVGFHSKSAFYSAFKKNTGTTPTDYKQRLAS